MRLLMDPAEQLDITTHPATADRWDDLLQVFGRVGCFGGCWCMYWRIKRTEMGRLGVAGRRAALKELTRRDRAPGILYYDRATDGPPQPFGWCAVGPREDFSVLQRSPLLKPVDDRPTWSIVCFFMTEPYRGRGLFRRLATLAIDYAREQGAERVEAYPRERHVTGPYANMGIASVYESLGFQEVVRRRVDRPVLRREL
jgi:GNAT superfamily N-acetyltransferase